MGIGITGSTMHVLTNKDIDSKEKLKVLNKFHKQDAKDSLAIAGTAATAGVVVAAATKSSPKFAAKVVNIANGGKEAVGNILSKIGIQKVGKSGKKYFVSAKGVVEKKLAEMAKNPNSMYSKFKALPTFAKAGIVAATATLAIASKILTTNNIAKKAQIETKAEKK